MKAGIVLLLLLAVLLFALPVGEAQEKGLIKIGIIGLDTSHVPAFTGLFNDPNNEGDLAGFKVVAGFRGGSKDIKASYSRVDMFTKTLQEKYGVEIVDSIDELVKKVDVVLIESVDGRPHLEQAIPVLKAGKKVFIDKPIAGSLADVLMIFALAKKYNAPVFSSSSLRYATNIRAVKSNPKVGNIRGVFSYSPCEIEPHHPDLFWYGIHGVESLYTLMGTGCKSVTRAHTKDSDSVTGQWTDGRIGTYRGLRKGAGYGTVTFGDMGIVSTTGFVGGYKPLVVEIAKFFRTGAAPVSAAETTEIFAFMEAADESKRQNGAPVTIDAVMKKAREFNKTRKLP
ncbi:MAG: Gfo/Idh/MocA family oxidoreductase [Planctomycetes bacterium]|jgi:predicted dehydrogenase|nr:Gfo/Idh/MocA family oxidoreductase [Planctomycetota bacterium]